MGVVVSPHLACGPLARTHRDSSACTELVYHREHPVTPHIAITNLHNW
jgi:hypothetical protein